MMNGLGIPRKITDPYEVLGLGPSAGEADVRAAYLRLAKKHHPDKNPGDKASEGIFKQVQSAYETLRSAEYGQPAGQQQSPRAQENRARTQREQWTPPPSDRVGHDQRERAERARQRQSERTEREDYERWEQQQAQAARDRRVRARRHTAREDSGTKPNWKEIVLQLLGAAFLSLLAIRWLAWFVWFLPLAATIGYFAIRRPNWTSYRFVLTGSSAAAATGIWAWTLLAFVGPNSGGEFLGYIALVAVGGFVLLLVWTTMFVLAKVQSEGKRIWLGRILIPGIVALGTWVLYTLGNGFWVLFGFFGYFLGVLPFLFQRIDPRQEVQD